MLRVDIEEKQTEIHALEQLAETNGQITAPLAGTLTAWKLTEGTTSGTQACTLADDSAFLPLLWNIEDDFEKKTAVIAGDWFRVMQENPAIPAGDAAFLLLEIDGAEYLAALKLNFKPGWLHYCRMDGGPAVNEVVRQGTVLPGTSGKADEATCAPTPCACWKKSTR